MNTSIPNILIIGSGNRVQQTILPALALLDGNINITAIISRTRKKIKIPGTNQYVITETTYSILKKKKIDFIIISVTQENVSFVLKELVRYDMSGITLLIDTPVLRLRYLLSAQLFNKFKHVQIAEDYISNTLINAFKNIISTGYIGNLQSIHLINNGYRHHAIAVFKYLAGKSYISRATRHKTADRRYVTNFYFSNGVICTLVEPRDYRIGRTIIIGSNGQITDFKMHNSTITSEILVNKKIYNGFKITGDYKYIHEFINVNYKKIINDINDRTVINFQKIEAINIMLTDMLFLKTNNYEYSYYEGLYDYFASTIIWNFGIFIDLKFKSSKNSFFEKILKLVTKYHYEN